MFNSNFIDKINSKEDFQLFLCKLKDDYNTNHDEWHNITIGDYLESINAWIHDVSKSQVQHPHFKNIDWSLIALILYMGKIYE